MIEVCCGSYQDAIAAYEGGAKRIELNTALHLGGLTPSLGELLLTKEKTNLDIICMLRPRGAGFCYKSLDIDLMFKDADIFIKNGCSGIAFGFLTTTNKIDVKNTQEMVSLLHYYGKEAVFHRAFDCVDNADEAIENLIGLGVDRILTSGLRENALEGKEELRKLHRKYGDKITLLAGCGVNENNILELKKYTGISEYHSSCKSWEKDNTTKSNYVNYSYKDDSMYEIVDTNRVRKLVALDNEY